MLASIKNLFYYFLFVTTLILIKVEGSKHFFQEEFLQRISYKAYQLPQLVC